MGDNLMAGQTILVADDDKGVRSFIVTWLTDEGYTLIDACDGEEVLQRLSTETIDLLITDIDMPILNGIDLIKQLRETQKTLPIIAISGNISHLLAAENLGANAAFVKPLDLKEMLAAIQTALSSSGG